MRQKIGIVLAFMCDPEVLILDEPTSGLDPLLQKTFHELLLEEQARGKTIFMSSHIMGDVEKVCQRVAVIRAILLAAIYPAISQAHINGYLESSIISSIAGGHINNFSGFTAFLVIFNKRDLPAV